MFYVMELNKFDNVVDQMFLFDDYDEAMEQAVKMCGQLYDSTEGYCEQYLEIELQDEGEFTRSRQHVSKIIIGQSHKLPKKEVEETGNDFGFDPHHDTVDIGPDHTQG